MWKALSDSDSDEDFQKPCLATPLTQRTFLSTGKNAAPKPLAPSNGHVPSRKKPKRSASTGKENGALDTIKNHNTGILQKQNVEGDFGAKREDLFVEYCYLPSAGCIGADDPERGNLLGSGDNEAFRVRNGDQKTEDSDEREMINDAKCAFDRSYAMSIEARLLRTRKAFPCLDENMVGRFKPVPHLSEMTSLCSEIDDEGNMEDLAEFFDREDLDDGESACQNDGLVNCPLCGLDITNMSEGQRHAHTNDCLDKDSSLRASVSTDGNNPMPKPAPNASRVLDFLRALGLSKYEESFIREEIDWDTLQRLTEEDLLGIGVVAFGPRKRILRALNDLCNERCCNDVLKNANGSRTVPEKGTMLLCRNKLITDYFQGSSNARSRNCLSDKSSHTIENGNKCGKHTFSRRVTVRHGYGNSRLKDAPSWCCIPGTAFRVDAFRFLNGECSHWFLTHFHSDHYQGLTKNFRFGKIYCSSITAKLVNMKIGVPLDRLHILPLNERVNIAGMAVTFLDANHCPGSVIILFELPSGQVILHTGDFRFCKAMTDCPLLQSCHVHTLILDTTYCNPIYDFPKQEAIIQFVIEAIQAEAFNPKTLFLIGSYTIGKERLFCEVARILRKKVFVGAAKLRILQCLGLPEEVMKWFTLNEMESNIHIVPMWSIASFKRMKHLCDRYSGRYNLIVSFSPTGWSFGKGKKKSGSGTKSQQGTIIRYEVPYSEHSSFSELQDFVRFLSPEIIIPSVNNDSQESSDAMVSLLMSQNA